MKIISKPSIHFFKNYLDIKSRRHEIKTHVIKATEKRDDIKLRRSRPIRLNFMSPWFHVLRYVASQTITTKSTTFKLLKFWWFQIAHELLAQYMLSWSKGNCIEVYESYAWPNCTNSTFDQRWSSVFRPCTINFSCVLQLGHRDGNET